MDRLTFDPTKILLSLHVEFFEVIDYDHQIISDRMKARVAYLIEMFTFSENERKKIATKDSITEYKALRQYATEGPLKTFFKPVFIECINFMKEVIRYFWYYVGPRTKTIYHRITQEEPEPFINNMQSLYDKIKLTQDISNIDARNTMIIISYRFLKSMENILMPRNQMLIMEKFLENNYFFTRISDDEIWYVGNSLLGETDGLGSMKHTNFFYINENIKKIGKSKGQENFYEQNIWNQKTYTIEQEYVQQEERDRIYRFFGPDITIEEASRNVKDFDRDKGILTVESIYTENTANLDISYFPTFFLLKEVTISFPVIFEKLKSPSRKRSRSPKRKRSKSPLKSRSRTRSKSPRTKKTKSSPRKIKKKK